MKTDAQPKKDVQAELEWDPSINAAEVGGAVKDGVVSLSGHLDGPVMRLTSEEKQDVRIQHDDRTFVR